jgi:hypothetical protein
LVISPLRGQKKKKKKRWIRWGEWEKTINEVGEKSTIAMSQTSMIKVIYETM